MMKTAEELFFKWTEESNDEIACSEMMIEFAKIHVQEALKQVEENILVIFYNKKNINDVYPIENIK